MNFLIMKLYNCGVDIDLMFVKVYLLSTCYQYYATGHLSFLLATNYYTTERHCVSFGQIIEIEYIDVPTRLCYVVA